MLKHLATRSGWQRNIYPNTLFRKITRSFHEAARDVASRIAGPPNIYDHDAKARKSRCCALTAINESVEEFFETVDTDRKKLSGQGWAANDWLVFASAGGKLPCAAYVRGDQISCDKTVIDQTLYWARVATEDEAIYITALINSQAVIAVIKAHQPRGAFGERHIHKLAFDRTPAFDSTDPDHRAIVDAAKALLSEWSARRMQPDIQAMLSPQKHMITRRTKIREALEQLPSWLG